MWAWLTKIRQDFGAWIVMRGKGMWVVEKIWPDGWTPNPSEEFNTKHDPRYGP